MEPLSVVELNISVYAGNDLRHGFEALQIDLFVFDAAPESLND
jgi:hypothetical protein